MMATKQRSKRRRRDYVDKRVIRRDFERKELRNAEGKVIALWVPGGEAIITDVNQIQAGIVLPAGHRKILMYWDFIVTPLNPGFGFFMVKESDIEFV